MSFILYFQCFDILRPCSSWRDCPSPGVSFLERAHTRPASEAFKCRSTNPESLPPTTSFIKILHSGTLLPCTLETCTRKLGAPPTTQSPLKWCRPTQPKPDCPASSIHSHRNHNEGSCPRFPSTSSASCPTDAFPCGPSWCAPSPGIREYKIPQGSHFHVCISHHTWLKQIPGTVTTDIHTGFFWLK